MDCVCHPYREKAKSPIAMFVAMRNHWCYSGMIFLIAIVCLFVHPTMLCGQTSSEDIHANLLVVGGSESAVAAAVQAARSGVQHIVLVNDVDWLGGQFSSEGLGAIDDWTMYRGRRVDFPESGLFLEIIRKVRQYNARVYGLTNPGNSFCATDTIRPAAAAKIFADFVAQYPQIQVISNYRPVSAKTVDNRLISVEFEGVHPEAKHLIVSADITIDASDWGDVIRLSGAKYSAGPDLKSRFNEDDAPAILSAADRNEMNPIAYDLVIEEAGKASIIPMPKNYDERRYYHFINQASKPFSVVPPLSDIPEDRKHAIKRLMFTDTDYPGGIYSGIPSIYTHRRLVDRYHNNLKPGSELVLLNFPPQDYPLFQFPKTVNDKLEAIEPGASHKNIVDMTYEERNIVFEDSKLQSLGFLYFLQTKASDIAGDYPQTFRNMKLVDDFGTVDHLPIKPYIREGLRLEATYMLREGDIKATTNVQSAQRSNYGELRWAKHMVPDNVFGFQFNLDFHPTRRVFLDNDPDKPWINTQTAIRNWSGHTDFSGFPYRSLVPIKIDGLLGAGTNLGVSSVVTSALRLHGQTMNAGQAAGLAAAMCIKQHVQPRYIAKRWTLTRELQTNLVAHTGGLGVILWPYYDVSPDDPWFIAVNMLAVRDILPGGSDTLDFDPWKIATRREAARAVARAVRNHANSSPYSSPARPTFDDVALEDPDFPYVESLVAWGAIQPDDKAFHPDAAMDWSTLYDWLTRLHLRAAHELVEQGPRLKPSESPKLVRWELARNLWSAIGGRPEFDPSKAGYLTPGSDIDHDGIPDLEDALPFDHNNDGIPDRIDTTTK